MSNNNHNNSSCAFAEQMVSYLYGEADAKEKYKFETHLKNCLACTDELAAFGFVRSAVLDWRAERFSKLPTPSFDIPVPEFKKSFSTTVVSDGNSSWFAGFRQMFSFNLMRATAAFGILVICAGVAWFAFNSFGGNEIAENENNRNLIQAAVSPTVEIFKKPEEKNVADKKGEQSSLPFEVTNSSQQTKREGQDRLNKSAIRVSNNAPKNNLDSSARNPKETNESIKKATSVRKKQIPNLNDAEDEEEDKTIRLADLFDELDTK